MNIKLRKMRNKITVGIVTFLSTIIVILLVSNISLAFKNSRYSFERNFEKNDQSISLDTSEVKLNHSEYTNTINSDSLIVCYDKKRIDTVSMQYTINHFETDFKLVKTNKVLLPRYSDESTPPFRTKGRHLFRSKVRQSNHPLSSLSKDDVFQS
jgi:hypothetical protein